MLVGLPETHRADVVAATLAGKIAELPEHLRRSLTWEIADVEASHRIDVLAAWELNVARVAPLLPRRRNRRGVVLERITMPSRSCLDMHLPGSGWRMGRAYF
jgi:transposase, IS30 family